MIDLYLLASLHSSKQGNMQTITESDKGNKFYVDGDKTKEVVLVDIVNGDYAKIELPDKTYQLVVFARLEKVLEKVEDQSDEVSLEYPEKVARIVFELRDEAGNTTVKWLEGEDAVQWNAWMRELCYKAEEVGMNPKWLSLKWKQKQKSKKA
jgi:hypothetical protein